MSIKISSIQGISAMSVNPINRWFRTNPDTDRNPLSFLPDTFQGTVAGYLSGGRTPPAVNIIDKFPFASDANATDVGDLTVARFGPAGQSSNVSGYASGGFIAPPAPSPLRYSNVIDKFPFATNANATDVGDLTQSRRFAAGQSSTVSGYTSGGQIVTVPAPPDIYVSTIDKFPFATNANATDVGRLTRWMYVVSGQSSDVSGYTSGGYGRLPPGSPRPASPATYRNIIDKFPFATDANATDVGDLTVARSSSAGQSSTVSGYASAGYTGDAVNVIDKFPFATDANATDVGDISTTISSAAGTQD